ncbi:calcium-binding mitochondrial carrier protein SCaMC-2-like [Tropilaelaps mercedesae]|uniref:Calcium-binding mitochondrial carrier protein SCaMC-2-like n=1 Tax=Tropilaelaps mercedesae TaxID=418985 RepID=A0A1V9XYX7_9ACAR|nr:calcium-binding mitochondrial carrier protein SCaMC-2-like [Tropilaelaps mercedesae]
MIISKRFFVCCTIPTRYTSNIITFIVISLGEDALVPDDFTEAELRDGIWWRHLVSGGVAGMVSRTCTAPLDRTKVHGKECGSVVNCIRILKKEGGARGLWRGNGINVIKIAPESALKFLTYDRLKNLIRGDEDREIRLSERFFAGALAGAIAQTIIYPMEVLKTRLALRRTGQYSGIIDAFTKIKGQEGWRALYRGYMPNLVGIFPYAGLDLAIYEGLKNWYIKKHDGKNDNKRPSLLVIVGIPLVSSSCGQAASYPLTLVRTRLQAATTTQVPKVSFINMLWNILQTEGYRGLYRGFAPNAMKAGPAAVISYMTYETALNFFGVQMT